MVGTNNNECGATPLAPSLVDVCHCKDNHSTIFETQASTPV